MMPVLLPLDVLLRTMQRKWDDGDHDGAVSLARIAAPYLHPRQTSRISRGEISMMDDEELDALCDGSDKPRVPDNCTGSSTGGEAASRRRP